MLLIFLANPVRIGSFAFRPSIALGAYWCLVEDLYQGVWLRTWTFVSGFALKTHQRTFLPSEEAAEDTRRSAKQRARKVATKQRGQTEAPAKSSNNLRHPRAAPWTETQETDELERTLPTITTQPPVTGPWVMWARTFWGLFWLGCYMVKSSTDFFGLLAGSCRLGKRPSFGKE